MSSPLSFDHLAEQIALGVVDTILVAGIDMQGRLMGKRFHAAHFIEDAYKGTHCCNYLLATDMEMDTVPGYRSASWEQGYGDYILMPDLTTLRHIPWIEGTALVLADMLDHHDKTPVAHSPRAMLKHQITRLDEAGLTANFSSELEFFLFRDGFENAAAKGYQNLQTVSKYNQDYHIFQTSKEESVMRAMRNGLYSAGIAVECSKGEASIGQQEINVRYQDPLTMADHHSIIKHGAKEIAFAQGHAVTFMAKWDDDHAGNSCHIHQSLSNKTDGRSAFYNPAAERGMTDKMRHYLAGQLKYARDISYFLAPYVNSYKRFVAGTFAPTRLVWSMDNRTAGFRIVGEHSEALRIECRVGGADLNPYLAYSALIAAGLQGIEEKCELSAPFKGDAYQKDELPEIPKNLKDAADLLNGSSMLRSAMGDAVIDHYVRAAEWEVETYDRLVSNIDLIRGFERA